MGDGRNVGRCGIGSRVDSQVQEVKAVIAAAKDCIGQLRQDEGFSTSGSKNSAR